MKIKEQTTKETKFLSCQVTLEFYERIAEAAYQLRMNRSEFIRSAIADKLKSMSADHADVC